MMKFLLIGPAFILGLAGCAAGGQFATNFSNLSATATLNAITAVGNTVATEVCATLPLAGNDLSASVKSAAQTDCANSSGGKTVGSYLTAGIQAAYAALLAAGYVL